MIWFTSDLHLGHQNIIAHTGRPWADADGMNHDLIANVNEVVGERDELYVLGDFSFRIKREEAARLRGLIRCRRVHLVKGNHDYNWDKGEGHEGVFIVEPPLMDLRHNRQHLILCHYPLLEWDHMHQGAIHLHGHIHSKPEYNERMRTEGILRYDVGVDANGYRPVSLDHVLEWFDGVEPACLRGMR